MSKRKILVVDDDEGVLDYLQAKLGARYDLVSTNVPGNVVKLAREQRPDIIVCDVDMPDMDGADVSTALHGNDGTRDIPLLFLTALATPQDLKRLQDRLGGRPAISKNAPMEQLVARIDSLVKA
jgi:two-component system sensor histidine kinase/response regulator